MKALIKNKNNNCRSMNKKEPEDQAEIVKLEPILQKRFVTSNYFHNWHGFISFRAGGKTLKAGEKILQTGSFTHDVWTPSAGQGFAAPSFVGGSGGCTLANVHSQLPRSSSPPSPSTPWLLSLTLPPPAVTVARPVSRRWQRKLQTLPTTGKEGR